MTLNAFTFAITTRETEPLGLAVLCVEARYASLKPLGSDRLVRRFAKPGEWREIEREIWQGLTTHPITAGVFHEMLVTAAEDRRLQWLHTMAIEADSADRGRRARFLPPSSRSPNCGNG